MMAKDTRTPRTTAETVSALEAARRNLILQDDDGTRFVCLLGPFLPVRVPPDRVAEDWFLRDQLRPWSWLAGFLILLVMGAILLLPMMESKVLAVVLILALCLALAVRRWSRLLASTRDWRVLPRLPVSRWYRLAFRQRAFGHWNREASLEMLPLLPAAMFIADGRLGLYFLLVFLMHPEVTVRSLLDLSLLAGRLVPAARRTC
jgi:hypothetical protein